MAASALNQIEEQFVHLPREDQLVLLERLVHQLRLGTAGNGIFRNSQPHVSPGDTTGEREWDRQSENFSAAGADLLSEAS